MITKTKVKKVLVNPIHKSVPLFIAFLAFWAPVIVFSKLAGEVLEKEPINLDSKILNYIHSHATHAYDRLFLTITTLGSFMVIAPLTIALIIWLYNKKYRSKALIVAFSVVGAATANFILKLLFQRSRPAIWDTLVKESSYSFPSGHAMVSCALIVSIILITWHSRARWWFTSCGIILIILIGLSRLYLGVHYPTDVVAGWSASIVWVSIVYTISKKLANRLHLSQEESASEPTN